MFVSVTPRMIAPLAPLEFELASRSEGKQRGREPGDVVGKSKAGSVGTGELAARLHAEITTASIRIKINFFILSPVYH